MATARAHTRIARPAAEVWKHITNTDGIVEWFPGVAACTSADGVRHVRTSTGIELDERIVTNDQVLRRFQYSIVPGVVPVEHHLATVDVIDDDAGEGPLVIYSVDVTPDAMGASMQQSVEAALVGLKSFAESAS